MGDEASALMSEPPGDDTPAILVVEDDEQGRNLLLRILEEEGSYQTTGVADAHEARGRLSERVFAAALIDYGLPNESGIEFLRFVRAQYPDVATIMVTALNDRATVATALDLGAFGYVVKPYRVDELLINLSSALHRRGLQIQTRCQIEELEGQVLDRTNRLREALVQVDAGLAPIAAEDVIERLSSVLTVRDEETGVHIRRMSNFTALLADRVGLDIDHEEIRLASAMHDIGKIGIPDVILQKPGPLSPDERVAMERHTVIGHQLLVESQSHLLRLGAIIALTHHEKWDGMGYPNRLAGSDIPAVGRLTAVADVFDALTSDRVYRPAMDVGTAVGIMREGRGRHFDPAYLDLFLDSMDAVLELRNVAQGHATGRTL
jgi:putative two-component system response regulator